MADIDTEQSTGQPSLTGYPDDSDLVDLVDSVVEDDETLFQSRSQVVVYCVREIAQVENWREQYGE